MQGLHEVIPRILVDIAEISQSPPLVNVYIDKDSDSTDSAYVQYLTTLLPEIISEAKTIPEEMGLKLYGKVLLCGAKTIESHCDKIKTMGTEICESCLEVCPAGIWLVDIIAHMFYLCFNEQNESVCEMIRDLCDEMRKSREKSFTIFVMPRDADISDTVSEYLNDCIWRRDG